MAPCWLSGNTMTNIKLLQVVVSMLRLVCYKQLINKLLMRNQFPLWLTNIRPEMKTNIMNIWYIRWCIMVSDDLVQTNAGRLRTPLVDRCGAISWEITAWDFMEIHVARDSAPPRLLTDHVCSHHLFSIADCCSAVECGQLDFGPTRSVPVWTHFDLSEWWRKS